MEKQIKIVRYLILGFGLVFFIVGAGLGFHVYSLACVGCGFTADYVLPSVFMGIGLLDITIISIWSFIVQNKAKREKWLFENGQCVKTKFDSIEVNFHVSVNNVFPFNIICHWEDNLTGELHTFKSKNIWFDPYPHVDRSKTIDVYFDPSNAKSYVVDLSFLPTVK